MPATSPQTRLNEVIESCNPFESHFIVQTHHVWDEDFPDVPSINADASELILETVRKIKAENQAGKVTGLAVLAPKGVGKTHVLSRVRRTLKREGCGFFIYFSEYGNLNRIKQQFLRGLASGLRKPGNQGVMQWQELAAWMVNKAVGRNLRPQDFLHQMPQVLARRHNLISELTTQIAHKFPDVENPDIIKAIIWTLSPAHAPYAINWLAGRELSENYAKQLDLPNPTKEDREAEVFSQAMQILNLIGHYTTPVLCFDQLDGTEQAEENEQMLGSYTRAMVVSSLVMDVYNNLQCGVLVSAMYARTFQEQFQQAANLEGNLDRLSHKEIELQFLKADDAVALVSMWLQEFYAEHDLTPPHPVHPFREEDLRQKGKGVTIRELLKWCAKNFSATTDIPKLLERTYHETESILEDFSDDNEVIANAIAFGLEHLKGETVEKVTVHNIDREVFPRSRHRGYINFRIEGEEEGNPVKIGVCVMQNTNGRTVGAAIKYLTQYEEFDLTRGCLVRSHEISNRARIAQENLATLQDRLGGEWVSFSNDQVKPLLTLKQMYKELDRDIISEEDFNQFIQDKRLIVDNPLLHEILSDPSGVNPEILEQDEEDLSQIFNETGEEADETEIDLGDIFSEVA